MHAIPNTRAYKYYLQHIDVNSHTLTYDWSVGYDTVKALLAGLENRHKYGNACFYGKGFNVTDADDNILFQSDTWLNMLDDLKSGYADTPISLKSLCKHYNAEQAIV